MKKIMFIVASLGVGGAQKIASFVMNTYCNNQYDVSVFSLSDEEHNIKLDSKIKVYYMNYSSTNKLISKLEEIYKTKEIINQINPDYVIIFGSYTFPSIGAVLSKKKIIGCERGDPYTYTKLRQLINKKLYRKYNFSVFQSEGARDYYKLKNENTKIIANPCFPSKIINIGDEDVIVGAGRLTVDKGFDTLIEAFASVKTNHSSFKLYIYGNGPYNKKLKEKVQKLNLTNDVVFKGKVNNLTHVFEHPKLFVLSSWFEGLPNTLIEAMSTGIPIVSSDCSPGGARYLTLDGTVGGEIVPIKDAKKMADSINKVINNIEVAKAIGLAGKKRVLEFNVEKIQEEWLVMMENM